MFIQVTNFCQDFLDLTQFANLIKGGNLVLYNLKNNSIDIDYLRGIHTIIPFQIQTDGVLYDTMSLFTHGYLKLLREIKRNRANENFPNFVQQLSRIEIASLD